MFQQLLLGQKADSVSAHIVPVGAEVERAREGQDPSLQITEVKQPDKLKFVFPHIQPGPSAVNSALVLHRMEIFINNLYFPISFFGILCYNGVWAVMFAVERCRYMSIRGVEL